MKETKPGLRKPKPNVNEDEHVIDLSHGGKVTCHRCNGFIKGAELLIYHPEDVLDGAQFHKECFNPYEHYYGLDRPID